MSTEPNKIDDRWVASADIEAHDRTITKRLQIATWSCIIAGYVLIILHVHHAGMVCGTLAAVLMGYRLVRVCRLEREKKECQK